MAIIMTGTMIATAIVIADRIRESNEVRGRAEASAHFRF